MDSEQHGDGARRGGGNGSDGKMPSTKQMAEEVHAQVDAQRPRAADTAQHAAEAARQAAQNLRGQEAWMAGLVEQGADRLGELAQTLRNNDLRTLLASVEDFARRQPVLFTGAAMALGFTLTRAVGAGASGAAKAATDHPREGRYPEANQHTRVQRYSAGNDPEDNLRPGENRHPGESSYDH